MTGAICTQSRETMSPYKKFKKPLVEKKRRERINFSLSNLKAILQSTNNQNPLLSKLEVADILELTVRQIRSTVPKSNITKKYKHGFNKCTSETLSYLKSTGDITGNVLLELSRHLDTKTEQQIPATKLSSTPRITDEQMHRPSFVKSEHSQKCHDQSFWRPWC